jgi:hypothetical protein
MAEFSLGNIFPAKISLHTSKQYKIFHRMFVRRKAMLENGGILS